MREGGVLLFKTPNQVWIVPHGGSLLPSPARGSHFWSLVVLVGDPDVTRLETVLPTLGEDLGITKGGCIPDSPPARVREQSKKDREKVIPKSISIPRVMNRSGG